MEYIYRQHYQIHFLMEILCMIGISISLIPTSPTDARGRERITKNLIHVYVFSTYEDIDIFWDTHNYVYPRLSDPTKLWSVYICILHEMVNTSGFLFLSRRVMLVT